MDKEGKNEIMLNGYEIYSLYISEIYKIIKENNSNNNNSEEEEEEEYREIILSYPPYLQPNHFKNICNLFNKFRDECINMI